MKGKTSERERTSKWSIAKAGMAVLLAALAVSFLTATPVMAQEAEVTVTVKAPEYVVEGETFDVTIDVEDIEDFNAGQFDLVFDPEVVEVKEVTNGSIGGIKIPITMWGEIDSDTIKIMPGLSGETTVSGTGYLAKITFEVEGEEGDECVLEISGKLVKIVKTDTGMDVEEEIPAEWIDAELKVGEEGEDEEEEEEEEGDEPTPTPTPSTSPTPTNVTNVTDVTNVTATPTPTLALGVTPTPEAKGTPTPTPKEKTTPKPKALPTGEKTTPTPTPKAPGFEAIFAIAVVGIAYILLRRNPFSEKGKKRKEKAIRKNKGGDKKKK